MNHPIHNVLVYGANGEQARPVVQRLLQAGHGVRVLVRNPAKAALLSAIGAEVVVGDLGDLQSLRRASAGMDGVYLQIPFFDPQAAYGVSAINAAWDAGVQLMVWNPTGAVLPVRTGNPGVDVRLDVLEHLRASALPFIVLQPTVYMENFLGPWTAPELARAGRFAYPIPRAVTLQPISHEDLAAYATAAFARPELAGSIFDVCGPERLNGDDIAERFSAALRRSISFRPMPPREFGDVMDAAFGVGVGEDAVGFYEAVQQNPALLSTDIDLQSTLAALPIRPTSLEDWVRINAAAFQAG